MTKETIRTITGVLAIILQSAAVWLVVHFRPMQQAPVPPCACHMKPKR